MAPIRILAVGLWTLLHAVLVQSGTISKIDAVDSKPWSIAIQSRSDQALDESIHETGHCSIPLGIARDSINIQVGFTIRSPEGEAEDGTLNSETAWGPQNLHEKTYIQVEFERPMLISGIITQGSPISAARVTHFKILYSTDCVHFTPVHDRHSDGRVFASNLEPNTTTTTMFRHVFYALCVRVVPTKRIGDETAMRFELLGCQLDSCKSPVSPVNVEQDLYWKKVEYDTEKILTGIRLVLNPDVTEGIPLFHMVYSRTCNFDENAGQLILRGNGEPVIFAPEEGSYEVTLNSTYLPIRAKCLAVYILDRERLQTRSVNVHQQIDHQRNAVEEFTLDVEGCDALEHHETSSTCGRSRIYMDNDATTSSTTSTSTTPPPQPTTSTTERINDNPDINSHADHVSRRQKRVVKGDPVIAGEYPWLVSLYYLGEHEFTAQSGLHHLCGASLIAEQWVLTTAHCFYHGELKDKENWYVVLGEHHQDSHDGTEQFIAVDEIIPHPLFVMELNTKILHDVALLKLSRPAILSDYVNTICLEPDVNFPDNYPCVTAGWGHVKAVNGVGVELPNHAEVRIMPQSTCAEQYESLPDDHEAKIYVQVDESIICAVDDQHERDSCYGDSGGPLICRNGDHWTQAGIVSMGFECGNARYPAIYTRVNYFYDWIQETIANNTDTTTA